MAAVTYLSLIHILLLQMNQTLVGVHHLLQIYIFVYNMNERILGIIVLKMCIRDSNSRTNQRIILRIRHCSGNSNLLSIGTYTKYAQQPDVYKRQAIWCLAINMVTTVTRL